MYCMALFSKMFKKKTHGSVVQRFIEKKNRGWLLMVAKFLLGMMEMF